jgi:hypothetical protein
LSYDQSVVKGYRLRGLAGCSTSTSCSWAAILVAGIVGDSRLASADEDRTLARVRGLRSDLIDPAIASVR